ncbi:MAG: hypothetical protein IKN12_06965, partial [Selenomonadaceae bacterium]|nr:hypothetical protein [Selenomonadaceae bacterium]
MFKNHVVVWVLATFVAVIFQFGQAEAADHYMGKYPDGSEAYLCSDKVVEISIRNDSYDAIYDVAVKKVVNGTLVDVDIYSVIYGQSYVITKNGKSLFYLRTAQNYLSTHEV